jgi:hypothetical protein
MAKLHFVDDNSSVDTSATNDPTVVGTPHDDTFTIHPGDTGIGLAGDDSITVAPLLGTGGSVDRAFVFGGPGNDTIIDDAIGREPGGVFPVTADGGPGNDTFVATAGGATEANTLFTGGPGHNTFEFSTGPFQGGGATITDFNQHDAIQIDVFPADPPTVTFTNNAGGTEVAAIANNARLFVELQGTFDTSQFHVTNDGMGHDIITFGHSDFHLA